MAGRRKFWLAMGMACTSLVLGLLVAEVIMRQVNRNSFAVRLDPWEDHPYRPYLDHWVTWGPLEHRLYTNSLGWKDSRPRHQVEKDPGDRTRIVFLGDSFTEGVGYPQEETISGRVERLLQREGSFEVLNGGRVSYCPLLSLQRLRRFLGDGYRTDLVVVLADITDVYDETLYRSRYELTPDGDPIRFRQSPLSPVVRTIYNSSALARSLRLLQYRLTTRPAPAVERPQATSAAFSREGILPASAVLGANPDEQRIFQTSWLFHAPSVHGWARAGLDAMLEDLGRIDQLTRERSIPLIVVIYPWPTMLYDREDPARYRHLAKKFARLFIDREIVFGNGPGPRVFEIEERLRAFCRGRSLPLVDLYPDIRRDPRWDELYIPGDSHFNEKGSQLVAERIHAAIRTTLKETSGGG